ncbi:MAG: DoxX family membrane protein [Planctomyces sp.]|nr:DoxX family membrane protein [Planctomyces sp.]
MTDWKRIPLIAVILIVLLRLSIGWQFLYEGIWKRASMSTSTPWTAEGYLKAAQGPFRDAFRGMTGDPDELGWLDYDTVSNRWTDWAARFSTHYRLDETKRAALNNLLDGPAEHTVRLEALPPGVELDRVVRDKLRGGPKLTYDASRKLLVLDASTPLKADEAAELRKLVPVAKGPSGELFAEGTLGEDPQPADATAAAFYRAIDTLERNSTRLSYRQKLKAALRGDPELVGVIARSEQNAPIRYAPEMGTPALDAPGVALIRYGEVQEYKDRLAAYEKSLQASRRDPVEFRQRHLEALWANIQALRVKLTGPIKTLEKSLQDDAVRLLSADQLAMGQMPREQTRLVQASDRAMWGLLILGVLLLAGLGTRIAAVAGAVMLMSFYLVVPPWPGVPQPPGPEHSLFINKNLIEALALLMIAATPSGTWFGLDGIVSRLFRRFRKS